MIAAQWPQTSATERNADASTLMAMFANQDVFTPATDAEIRQHKNADYPGSPASVETLLQGMHTSVEQINEPLLLISKAAPRKAEHAEDKG